MFSRGQSCEITITRLTRTGIFGEIEQQKHRIRLRRAIESDPKTRQSLQSNANFIFYQTFNVEPPRSKSL
ncbi:unnamed protein product [Rhizophagus irregularis]|nr:unnamed protein product [Rhizophagus irregularis]